LSAKTHNWDLKRRLDHAIRAARRKVEEAGQRLGRKMQQEDLDQDAERIIAYLNDEIVPAVRNHSSRGLRVAARKFAEFADYLDRRPS
jgi:hypothetical protein